MAGQRLLLVEAGDLDDQLHCAQTRVRRGSWGGYGARCAARPGGVPYTRASSMPQHPAGSAAAGALTVSTSSAPETAARTSAAATDAARQPGRSRAGRGQLAAAAVRRPRRADAARRARLPDYANYDSVYTLVWGRELLRRPLPSFDAYRAPTEHPLWVASGWCWRRSGSDADRVLVGLTLAASWCSSPALYRLGATSFTPLVGLDRRGADPLHALRLPVPRRARLPRHPVPGARRLGRRARGRAPAPRHAGAGPAAAAAGLLRPEAWLLRGLYWLWLFSRRDAGASASATRCSSGAAPLVWMATDLIVTGDPLFSQNHTSGLAEELGRNRASATCRGDRELHQGAREAARRARRARRHRVRGLADADADARAARAARRPGS